LCWAEELRDCGEGGEEERTAGTVLRWAELKDAVERTDERGNVPGGCWRDGMEMNERWVDETGLKVPL